MHHSRDVDEHPETRFPVALLDVLGRALDRALVHHVHREEREAALVDSPALEDESFGSIRVPRCRDDVQGRVAEQRPSELRPDGASTTLNDCDGCHVTSRGG